MLHVIFRISGIS